jgi:hypothetical protein
MEITFEELCQILARVKSIPPDFWKQDPLYIQPRRRTRNRISFSGAVDGRAAHVRGFAAPLRA